MPVAQERRSDSCAAVANVNKERICVDVAMENGRKYEMRLLISEKKSEIDAKTTK